MIKRTGWFWELALIGLSTTAAAEVAVHDALIETTDRTCAVHYLSHQNTTGWYLTDVEGSCANGVLDGDAFAVVRNAFGKEVDRLSGFFNQGYWTGRENIDAPLAALYLHDSQTQTLTCDLGREDRLDIRYTGKLTAERRADKTYGPFLGCQPAQVLAQTPVLDLFEDEAVQQELINSVINRVHRICPKVEQIYFYGSDKDNPDNQDIAFFADINLKTRQIKVRRLPSSDRDRDILQNPEDRAPARPRPLEVRQEKALPVVAVKPIKVETKHIEETVPTVQQPVIIPVIPPATPALQSMTVSETASQESMVQQTQQPTPPMTLDAIPNLLTAARLLKQPVDGKAKVHIARFEEDGSAVADKPVALVLRGHQLSIGWGVVEGTFTYNPPSGRGPEVRGFVQVTAFTPTESE